MRINLFEDLNQAGKNLKSAIYIASVTFMFPITLINKYIYTRMTARKFQLSSANMIDLTIFALVVFLWERIFEY